MFSYEFQFFMTSCENQEFYIILCTRQFFHLKGGVEEATPKYTSLTRASDRVRKKIGNYAALLSPIMRQQRSIMRQIMRFHLS